MFKKVKEKMIMIKREIKCIEEKNRTSRKKKSISEVKNTLIAA